MGFVKDAWDGAWGFCGSSLVYALGVWAGGVQCCVNSTDCCGDFALDRKLAPWLRTLRGPVVAGLVWAILL